MKPEVKLLDQTPSQANGQKVHVLQSLLILFVDVKDRLVILASKLNGSKPRLPYKSKTVEECCHSSTSTVV